jgi:hypothetical protein
VLMASIVASLIWPKREVPEELARRQRDREGANP